MDSTGFSFLGKFNYMLVCMFSTKIIEINIKIVINTDTIVKI